MVPYDLRQNAVPGASELRVIQGDEGPLSEQRLSDQDVSANEGLARSDAPLEGLDAVSEQYAPPKVLDRTTETANLSAGASYRRPSLPVDSLNPDSGIAPTHTAQTVREPPDSRLEAKEWKSTVTDPWSPCILALDGGGIRGYSSVLILQRLMAEIQNQERTQNEAEPFVENLEELLAKLHPCHYFDYMFGTSTGGLIALMLARLRMSIEECLVQYCEVGNKLFRHRKSHISYLPVLKYIPTTKYKSRPMVKVVNQLVAEKRLGKEHAWDLSGNEWDPRGEMWYRVCQSCCLTATDKPGATNKKAELLRSYNHFPSKARNKWVIRYDDGAEKLDIWQVARSTSAAPTYFKKFDAAVDGKLRGFKDGGIRENNPAKAAYFEFVTMYHHTNHDPQDPARPALLLSIGTGNPVEGSNGFAHQRWPWSMFKRYRDVVENGAVLNDMRDKYTDTDEPHDYMRNTARGEHTWYKRLNVDKGMDHIPLDDWRPSKDEEEKKKKKKKKKIPGGTTLREMREATDTYLARAKDDDVDDYAAPQDAIRDVAEKLVRVRRARQRLGGRQWEYYFGEGLQARMASRN